MPINLPLPRVYDAAFWVRFDQSQVAIRRGHLRYLEFLEMRQCKAIHVWRLRKVHLDLMLSDFFDLYS